MADIQKLIGSESPLEVGQKINEIIEKGGGGLEVGDIGIAPLGIDETKGKRRYLNGQVILQEQYVQFTNKVKSAVALYPTLACTESEWQTTATMTVGGQVGKFVVDDEAGTIRLPKIIMPIQGLTDLSKLAEIVKAGLPNITGQYSLRLQGEGYTGAFYNGGAGGDRYKSETGTGQRGMLDASLSSPIYGRSTTVQQEQIQYPYFIQVATGAETEDNIINEIELNNPFSLLDYKYSEYELNNLSWLRSNGQYNSKAIYPAVYDLLLKIYNGTETKAGVSVKLTTETFDDYDFVLNTAEETFRLPTKVKLASGKAVVGNGMTLGLTDGTNNAGLFNTASGDGLFSRANVYGSNIGTSLSDNTDGIVNSIGVTTDPTKSGIETSDSGLYLYFYVGETVQNANLINAGRIEEKIASLIPDNSSLISSYGMTSKNYINLTVGASGTTYTAPANGWFYIGFTFTTAANNYVGLRTEEKGIGVINRTAVSGTAQCFIPVTKGDEVRAIYSNTDKSTTELRFNYAEGEQ